MRFASRPHSWTTSLFFAFLLLWTGVRAQEGELDKSPPKGMTSDEVIRRFTANEKEWKRVREQYRFRQSITVKALNGNEEIGEYRQVADVHYVSGQRIKSIVFAPQASIDMSKEDLNDLETRSSFTISRDEVPEYDIAYAGQQNLDELHCYMFEVTPKQMVTGKRYFQGTIWVDDRDFQIVKNRGKSVPDIRIVKKKKLQENLFPQFTTWRQQIDGKYWFPTFSSADDTLHFNYNDLRIKQVLKFSDYKRVEKQTNNQRFPPEVSEYQEASLLRRFLIRPGARASLHACRPCLPAAADQ
jgi:hypothetical protein